MGKKASPCEYHEVHTALLPEHTMEEANMHATGITFMWGVVETAAFA